jgi:glucose/arabinose dehydrogenase
MRLFALGPLAFSWIGRRHRCPMALMAVLVLGPLFLPVVACGRPPPAPHCQLVTEGFGSAGSVPVRTETVVTGLEVPWGIAFLPDGDLLVTERPGRVRRVQGGQLAAQPVLRLEVAASGEGGLMGIALHPRFADNRLFYLYYTARKGDRSVNRLERFRLAPDKASATSDRVVLDDLPAGLYHDGGRLHFGPDGMLYVGTGDARDPSRSQNVDDPAGKLLRVGPDGEVPADNPWPGKRAFLAGIRNLEAFDWRDPGTLVVVDHGPSGELGRSGHDEVSVARAGQNLGWPTIYSCQSRAGLVSPSLTWDRAAPPGGAAIYTGTAIADWRGSLLIGTLGSRHLHRVVFDPANPVRVMRHEVYLDGEPPAGLGRLREVAMGPDGHLYVTTSNCDGRGRCPPEKDIIVRVVPAAGVR